MTHGHAPEAGNMNTNTLQNLDFGNTAVAFQNLSTPRLRQSYRLFKLFQKTWLVKCAPTIATFTLKTGIPLGQLFSRSVFRHFCGGETIQECVQRIEELKRFGIGTILDYATEQLTREEEFKATAAENIRNIEFAAHHPEIPFCVFKPTGVMRSELLEKISANKPLSDSEKAEFARGRERFSSVCIQAEKYQVRLFVDAEETWMQAAIDQLVEEMMQIHNKKMPIVFNTVQMYRTDRLDYIKTLIDAGKKNQFYVGFKIVRGAYMEKERARAQRMGYPSPIYPTKEDTDNAYDTSLRLCADHWEHVSVCAGTHNEQSTQLLTELIAEKHLSKQDPRASFAQLLGMSDHLTFNLAHHHYNVAKYMPYGRLKQLLPYLARRAQENSAIQGQTARELLLIEKELKRRTQH